MNIEDIKQPKKINEVLVTTDVCIDVENFYDEIILAFDDPTLIYATYAKFIVVFYTTPKQKESFYDPHEPVGIVLKDVILLAVDNHIVTEFNRDRIMEIICTNYEKDIDTIVVEQLRERIHS